MALKSEYLPLKSEIMAFQWRFSGVLWPLREATRRCEPSHTARTGRSAEEAVGDADVEAVGVELVVGLVGVAG